MYVLSHLDEGKLRKLREFENERGVKVLAFSEMNMRPAPMDDRAVHDLKELEEQLGVTLVAYE